MMMACLCPTPNGWNIVTLPEPQTSVKTGVVLSLIFLALPLYISKSIPLPCPVWFM